MAQRVIGNIRQRIVLRLRDLIDNLRLAHARIACHVGQLVFLVGNCFFICCLFFRILRQVQNKRTGIRFVSVFIRRTAVGECDCQGRVVESERLQFFVCGAVAHVVCQIETSERRQPFVDGIRVQRGPICEVHVVRADACTALVIGDGIRFLAGECDLLHRVKFRDGIIKNHIPQDGIKFIQRVVADKICLAVTDGNIPLLVHFAEVTELDGIAFLVCGNMDRTDRLVKAVLSVVLYIVNGKCSRKGCKLFQQVIDLFLVHGEGVILVVDPRFVFGKGECSAFIRPRKSGNAFRGNFQYHFAAVFDLLFLLLIATDGKCGDADHKENAKQCIEFCCFTHDAFSSCQSQ